MDIAERINDMGGFRDRIGWIVAGATISAVATTGFATFAASRGDPETAEVTPDDDQGSVNANGALSPTSIEFLNRVNGDGVAAQIPQTSMILRKNEAGHACVTLVLSDWSPSACGSLDDAERGHLIVSAQADGESPRFVAMVVPDGASLWVNGAEQPVANNSWIGEVDDTDRIAMTRVDGSRVDVGLGADL